MYALFLVVWRVSVCLCSDVVLRSLCSRVYRSENAASDSLFYKRLIDISSIYMMKDRDISIKINIKIHDTCILPSSLYGCQTWALSELQLKRSPEGRSDFLFRNRTLLHNILILTWSDLKRVRVCQHQNLELCIVFKFKNIQLSIYCRY